MSEDNKPKEEVVWTEELLRNTPKGGALWGVRFAVFYRTEELLRERRKRATIMAIALLAFIALFFWVTLVKLGANVANRPL